MKIDLFGGSFDPVHRGHIDPVQAARRALGLERVIYLPTAQPPHKPERMLAPALRRYAMVELALLDEPGLEVSGFELTLGRPAYTVETLEHFRRELPDADLHLLIGGDSFADLHHWVRFREIPELARLVVLTRPGWEPGSPPLPPELTGLVDSGRAVLLHQPPVDVSSTRLRELLSAGHPLPAGAVPNLVVRYLQKYALYR